MATLARSALFGIVGGTIMAMAGMIMTAFTAAGPFAVPTMMGSIVLGPQAAQAGGAGVIMIGLLLHMLLSAMFGIVFGAIVRQWPKDTIGTGATFGLALWFLNFHLLARFVPGAAAMAAVTPVWIALLTHLIFGLAVGALEHSAHTRSAYQVNGSR